MMATADTPLSQQNIVAFLGDIFERRGGEEYLGEPVTMAQHMLQSASFAEAAEEPDIIVVAALLHDIGHFTSEFGMFSMQDTEDKYHEEAVQQYCNGSFPNWLPIVCAITLQPNGIYVQRTPNISANCLQLPCILSICKAVR